MAQKMVPMILLAALLLAPPIASGSQKFARVEAGFGGDCKKLLLSHISSSRKELRVAIYMLTDSDVVNALIRAFRRGVDVVIKYDFETWDRSEYMQKSIGELTSAGVDCVPIDIEGKRGKMHHKFVVSDRKAVATGSFNFTVTASEVSYENLVVIKSSIVARDYLKHWDDMESDEE